MAGPALSDHGCTNLDQARLDRLRDRARQRDRAPESRPGCPPGRAAVGRVGRAVPHRAGGRSQPAKRLRTADAAGTGGGDYAGY
jgi:hypothetical protein